MKAAPWNAKAVCPEGKEWSPPLGRLASMPCFSTEVMPAVALQQSEAYGSVYVSYQQRACEPGCRYERLDVVACLLDALLCGIVGETDLFVYLYAAP